MSSFFVHFHLKVSDYTNIYNAHGLNPDDATFSIVGSWDSDQHHRMAPDLEHEGYLSTCLWMRAGQYVYWFEIDGFKTPDMGRKFDNKEVSHIIVTAETASKFRHAVPNINLPILQGPIHEPDQAFQLHFHDKLQLAEVVLVKVMLVNDDMPIIMIVTTLRAVLRELGLPETWRWNDQIYRIALTFEKNTSRFRPPTRDRTSLTLARLLAANHSLHCEDQAAIGSFVNNFNDILGNTKGRVDIFPRPIMLPDGIQGSAIVLVFTDWTSAFDTEPLLPCFFAKLEVVVLRDKLVYLPSADKFTNSVEEDFYMEIVIGKRGGGGGMSLGAILRDQNNPNDLYMVQCGHGYKHSYDVQDAYYPPPNFCERAAEYLKNKAHIMAGVAAQGNQNPAVQRIRAIHATVEAAINQLQEIEIPVFDASTNPPTFIEKKVKKVFTNRFTPEVRQLSIGTCVAISPEEAEIDIALIKLHPANIIAGHHRTFMNPVNTLDDGNPVGMRRTCISNGMPATITALTTKTRVQIGDDYARGETMLHKFGATTGWGKFHTMGYYSTYRNGKTAVDLIALNGFEANDDISLPGDSSAPVFGDDCGQNKLMGMIIAKMDSVPIGYMMPVPILRQFWESHGYNLSLA